MLAAFGPASNVDLVCGPASNGYVDIDIDDDIATLMAPSFLPETSFVFGRESRPASHYGYRVNDQLSNIILKAPPQFDLRPFVEILAQDHLVRVPPSIHPKDGELVRFENDAAGLPALVDPDVLIRQAVLLAIATFVARMWPKKSGNRNLLALALAGALIRSGLEATEVRHVLLVATKTAGDDEFEKRAEAVDDTAKKLLAKDNVTGWPTVGKVLGDDGPSFVETIHKWLPHIELISKPISLLNMVISTNELLASSIPERADIVRPWLKQGAVILVFAPTKVGKTWFCLELAICIVTGQEFLDYEVIGKHTALYLDGEMMSSEIKSRVGKLHGGDDNFLVLMADTYAEKFGRSLDLTIIENQQAVECLIEEHKVDVLIIDTLASLAPRCDENDNASPQLQSLMRWTLKLKARGVAVVLVHHSGHEGKHPRGASALPSSVDTVVALRKNGRNDGLLELEFTHTRDKRPDPPKRTFQIIDSGEVIALDVVGGAKHQPAHDLLPYLLNGKCHTQKELAHAMGKSVGAINGWLSKLRAQGLVEKKGLVLTVEGKKQAKSMS